MAPHCYRVDAVEAFMPGDHGISNCSTTASISDNAASRSIAHIRSKLHRHELEDHGTEAVKWREGTISEKRRARGAKKALIAASRPPPASAANPSEKVPAGTEPLNIEAVIRRS